MEIWDSGGLARSGLSTRLDLSQQSIHRIITQLVDRGLVILGEPEPPAYKGKPSPRLVLNAGYTCAIGISIDTDSAGLAILDFGGSLWTRSIRIEHLPMEEVLSQLDNHANRLLTEAGLQRELVFGVGFAISGFVVEGTRYNPPVPLSHWSSIHLGPFLADWFGLPVWTENGANTGALCERMLGVGRTINDFVYLSFNYGFGAGIILGGNLIKGGFGNAGELSGMFTRSEKPHRPALRTLLEMVQARGVDVQTIDELSQHFDMSWPGVADWVDRVADQHNRVINVLSAVVDPEVVVFGGQIPPPLAEALISRTVHYQLPRHGIYRRMPRLCVSQVRGETAAIGAASLALKAAFF